MRMASLTLHLRPVTLGLAFALLCSGAQADNVTSIDGNAFGFAQGNLQLNLAAGDGNEQANAASLAVGRNANATTSIRQVGSGVTGSVGQYTATIGGNAFGYASGLISVNEASGANNLQANSIAIGIGSGAEALSSNNLSQVTGGGGQTPTGTSSNDHVAIGGNAFAHANGLVQINQTAGTGNASANRFALELNLGGKP